MFTTFALFYTTVRSWR